MKVCLDCDCAFEAEGWRCPACGHEPACIEGYPAFAPRLAASNDGYDPERFAEIPGIDDEHFLRRARNRLFTWAMSRYFPDSTSFLEIGSGIGVVLKAFHRAQPELDLWGSEIYSDGLNVIAQNVPGVHAFQADARHLPFQAHFDVVGAFDVIEHVDDDRAVLRELHRAVKPSGGILLSVPQHRFLWSQRDEYVCHKRRYTRKELVGKLTDAGFEPLRVTSFVTLPFPLMLLATLRNRKPREGYDPFAEFKVGRVPTAILNAVLDAERSLLRAGLSFPFGGTLFAAARRA